LNSRVRGYCTMYLWIVTHPEWDNIENYSRALVGADEVDIVTCPTLWFVGGVLTCWKGHMSGGTTCSNWWDSMCIWWLPPSGSNGSKLISGWWVCRFLGQITNRGNHLRATSHTRLRARDHYTSSTLIGGKGSAGPSSLHTTLEGLTEYVTARWM